MLETTILTQGTKVAGEIPSPQIKILEADDTYGSFTIEPLERGYAITIGNSMRRVLLSSMPGSAITWVRIDDVLHEYGFLPKVKEEVMEFLLNVKLVRIRSVTDRPGKMRLEVTGEGRVCAGDIATSADFEIINPELHLATLDADDASLSVEFNVERGLGYLPAGQSDGTSGLPIGVLPMDAAFSPVHKVKYSTERTRVGEVTDSERLVLEIWTDGTITPIEAMRKASEVLVNHFFLFSNLGKGDQAQVDGPSKLISPEAYQTPIEKLDLSPRTLNCLKRAHITKVGQVLETPHEELLKIRNFGERSLQELLAKLETLGMAASPEQQTSQPVAGKEEEGELEESYGPAEGRVTVADEEEKEDLDEEAVLDEEDDEEEDVFDEDEEEE